MWIARASGSVSGAADAAIGVAVASGSAAIGGALTGSPFVAAARLDDEGPALGVPRLQALSRSADVTAPSARRDVVDRKVVMGNTFVSRNYSVTGTA